MKPRLRAWSEGVGAVPRAVGHQESSHAIGVLPRMRTSVLSEFSFRRLSLIQSATSFMPSCRLVLALAGSLSVGEEIPFGCADQVVVFAGRVLEGGHVVSGVVLAPGSLEGATGFLRFLKGVREPERFFGVGLSMRASEGSKVVCAVGDPVREAEGCVVGVGGEGRLVDGERGEELFFGDFVPLSTTDGLSAEVAGLASECEVDTAVVGPV
ncbi:hypothetical protein NDU88_002218 [Pleurodeles waltl]|uniref:Uncharacterized protein n=1 Tax=Pleurodeles waltl TaxID=8319 RepID=A0AAV7M0W8_PLEWA|nr:hypothetical protein NDU88_002218 [Pleurodeles waltl]